MDSIIMFIACLLIYMALYTLIDRICKCVEYCAMVKGYATLGGKVDVDTNGFSNKAK